MEKYLINKNIVVNIVENIYLALISVKLRKEVDYEEYSKIFCKRKKRNEKG